MRTKLIEVSLPLDAINAASAREKSIRHGHPSTLHLWWARRPLAAARAVIFGQMVDDPSSVPEEFPTEEEQQIERERLFDIVRELVQWENTGNKVVLEQARTEIYRSWRRTCSDNADHPRAVELFDPDKLPAFHDPFAGGGSLPLEAQRLGLEAHASDLNPVAVLINKAMIEIPPKFAGRPPVNPKDRTNTVGPDGWSGASGLAADVRYYGEWIRNEAEKRIGHLYPKVEITAAMAVDRPDLVPYVGRKLTVIAWLWARTVRSPNPAYAHVNVPLVSSFVLSSKKGKEAYIEPVINGDKYGFKVKMGSPPAAAISGTKLSRGANFQCLVSGSVIEDKHVKQQSMEGSMGERLITIVLDGGKGRIYLDPIVEHETLVFQAAPKWKPDEPMNRKTSDLVSGRGYGFFNWSDLFTARQLVALTSFSDLIQKAHEEVQSDVRKTWTVNGGARLSDGGDGAHAYAEAVAVYLALTTDKACNHWSSICGWNTSVQNVRATFARQAIPMMWDFAEANPFSQSGGNWLGQVNSVTEVLKRLPLNLIGIASQGDSSTQQVHNRVISTDPPYYDNIGYADLSDFFYVWLRPTMREIYPAMFATMAVPKSQELVATSYRHGSKQKARKFFLDGMRRTLCNFATNAHQAFPVTIYYAFKQTEQQMDETNKSNSGWETFLQAVIDSGFTITGTFPMRTERSARPVGIGTNALAASIVIVCRQRYANAPLGTRVQFIRKLRDELQFSLVLLRSGSIAPVDLAQAAIGPGMKAYTSYEKLLTHAS